MNFNGTPLQYTLLALLTTSALFQVWYYIRYYLRSARWRYSPAGTNHAEPVSVIICSRNEAENLREYLPLVLNQNHPDFEVIVVNDASEDDSDLVLSAFMSQYPNLRISNIKPDPRFHHNKKLAQVIGIKAAKNNLLLLTDAGCRPESDSWLTQMTAPMANGWEIVLGYAGYSGSPGLLNRYVRYDAMFIAMQYTGMALAGMPYMGVGRNLAYRKDLFMKGNGFASHYHIASGDDDLFVNANATAVNTAVELGIDAQIRSLAPSNINEFFRQKKRRIITTPLYKTGDRIRIILEPVARTIFHVSAGTLISMLFLWPLILGVLMLLILLKLIVLSMASKTFNEKGLVLPSLMFDIISPVINSLLYIAKFGNQAGKKAWR